MTQAKICGLSTPETVDAALAGKAAFVGFMFFAASFRAPSPRTPPVAGWRVPARNKAKIVAVTVDADDAALDLIMAQLKPDLIQLHGRETPARAQRHRPADGGRDHQGAAGFRKPADLDAATAFDGLVDHLMPFDAKSPKDADRPGGLGTRFDWTLTAGRRFERPWLLAGGLDPWNVAEAVRLSGAPLVDVSSGVERGPGLKDPALISAFLEAVRRAWTLETFARRPLWF